MSVVKFSLTNHMKDQRFKRTEEKILTVIFNGPYDNITTIKIAKQVGVCRSTIYAHHRKTSEILPDYQRYIVSEYELSIRELDRHNPQLKKLFFDFLVFIIKHKKVFQLFFKFKSTEALKSMLGCLRPQISQSIHLPKNSDKIFSIYTSEVIQVIENWNQKNFSEADLENVLSDILFLTNTCRTHLMPINH